eukprot:scaffold237342_cov23-Tisochrysis_lutea.AAC.1
MQAFRLDGVGRMLREQQQKLLWHGRAQVSVVTQRILDGARGGHRRWWTGHVAHVAGEWAEPEGGTRRKVEPPGGRGGELVPVVTQHRQ